MNNNNQLTIDTASISPAISFSTSNSGQHYRCITATKSVQSDHSIEHQQISFVPHHIKQHKAQQIDSKSKSLSFLQYSMNSDVPNIPSLQPLDFKVTSMEIENEDNSSCSLSPIIPPPSKVQHASFSYYNELNSFLVDNADYNDVLKALNVILSDYYDDIDFKVDHNNKCVEGLVFMGSYYVSFIIYVWSENANQTRMEFRRMNGDSLASAKFWAQIKGLYQGQSMNDESMKSMDIDMNSFDFISLDLGTMDNENNMQNMSKSELDQITESLKDNDLFVVDELNFLYEQMVANHDVCYDILSHQSLMNQLINKALLNNDICVSRIGIKIVSELVKTENNNMSNMKEFELFNNINLLLNHQRALIRKYAMRLLSDLSIHTDCTWNIDDVSREQMIANIKKYQSECTDNLDQEMIQRINEKLMT